MPYFRLGKELVFPDPRLAEDDGLLAIGGDLSPERLLLAYSLGIFPWYSKGQPILWWSPDPRTVLLPEELHVSRSLRKQIRRNPYEIKADTAFREVIHQCSSIRRRGQRGTWITREMQEAYVRLHELGVAHSIEAWEGESLVGGLYGVSLGGAFFGESMFALREDASKISFVYLVETIRRWGFSMIDCQMPTEHLARFGSRELPRESFFAALESALQKPTQQGKWQMLSLEEILSEKVDDKTA